MAAQDIRFHMERVNNLSKRIADLQQEVRGLETEMKAELQAAIELCGRQGHDFVRRPDADCHKPGWFYECQLCGHWTR